MENPQKLIMKNKIIQEIKEKNLPVIICGAGIVGETLLSICEKEGIKVDSFCDNSKKTAGTNFCGLKVHYMPELKSIYDNAVLLLSVAAIKDVVDLINDLGYENWYSGSYLLKGMELSQDDDFSIDYKKFAIDNCIVCHEGFLNSEKIFFRSIDLIITEKCSLKCVDCSNLMQYYENPQNCDTEMLLKSIDLFCEAVDEVMEFRIIGGETFMNKEWPIIVEKLVDEPKIRRIVLYTNSTIVPNKKYIKLLQHKKVLIIATDYGNNLSKKLTELKNLFEENKISHHILKFDEWLDCSSILQHNRTHQGNMEIFKQCCAKNMATLSDGKIFRCPYAANANRLKAVPDFRTDYVDLFEEKSDKRNLFETRKHIKDYMFRQKYLVTCDFCPGRPLSGIAVKPAVQVVKPLEYNKFT